MLSVSACRKDWEAKSVLFKFPNQSRCDLHKPSTYFYFARHSTTQEFEKVPTVLACTVLEYLHITALLYTSSSPLSLIKRSSFLTGFDDFHLSIHSDMGTVAKAMASPESGLEVRDRMWLKITIPNAFIGNML